LVHRRFPKEIVPQATRWHSADRPNPRAPARPNCSPTDVGFLLLDSSARVLCANTEARLILCYPAARQRAERSDQMLAKALGDLLADALNLPAQTEWWMQLTSGRRRYRCRVIAITVRREKRTVLLLERAASRPAAVFHLGDAHRFTPREREAVHLLAVGLTNKEIAERMRVSVNTVKAFIRLVMRKVGVGTRTGIIGRLTQMD
jgi:DNA-binding CsgD family transcriptional regulator